MPERNHFSLAKTAGQLKISRHAFHTWIQRLNISADDNGEEDKVIQAGTKIDQS
jgi:hypothetical protein